ncbi:MAG: hypothetical protein ACE5FI_01570 [Anaerolineales bacterium]
MKALRAGLLVAVLTVLLAPAGAPLQAQTPTSGLALTIRAGYDGFVKEMMWAPVRVTVSNDGADVQGVLRIEADRFDGSTLTFERPIDLPSRSRKEVFMYTTAEGFLNRVQVSLVRDEVVLADVTTRVSLITTNDILYGVIAADPTPYQVLADIDPVAGQGYFAQLTLADLPPASAAWRSLDVLVLSDTDTGVLSPAQFTALESWIAGGGKLIVTGGPGWQRTFAGLGDLVPAGVTANAAVADLSALGAYAVADAPEGPAYVSSGSVADDADVLLAADGVALIVERLLGYGAVEYLAFDPALAPFSRWRGMEGVYRNLLSERVQPPSWTNPLRNWYNASETVNAVPGVDLPSTLQLCAFAGAYVFVVGPLNFIFLRRIRKREYAWLTIPGLVILFSGISYLAGFSFRGTRPILHRVSVVHAWEGADRAQVEMLVGLFSPRRARYDVQVTGDALLGPIPVDSFSGPAGASIDESTLEFGATTIARGMQVDVGAVKPFTVSGQIAAPRFSSDLAYDFDGHSPSRGEQGVSLVGTVTNRSAVALTDAVILAPSSVQSLGDIGPGGELNVNVPLAAGRAAPGVLLGAAQVLPPGAVVSPLVGGNSSRSYDTTIDDILGASGASFSYYDDREVYRRFSLLQWLVDPYNGGARGSGVFLVGWVQQAPLDVTILDRPFETADETLYIVSLRPRTAASGGAIAIPPELMTWELLDPGSGSGDGPYEVYLYEGAYALRFRPQSDFRGGAVQGLTLHLDSYGATGRAPLNVSLRDQQRGTWVTLPGLEWGDTSVQSPQRFVAADGRIDVRVENPDTAGRVSIERLDFTLTLER